MINSAIGLRQILPWQTNKIFVIAADPFKSLRGWGGVGRNSPDGGASGLCCIAGGLSAMGEWTDAGSVCAFYAIVLQMKVTIWARVQLSAGLNVVLLVPLVMFSFTAHRTASA